MLPTSMFIKLSLQLFKLEDLTRILRNETIDVNELLRLLDY